MASAAVDVDFRRHLQSKSATRWSSSPTYDGTHADNKRQTESHAVFHSIHSGARSQWRSQRSDITCSYFRSAKIRRTARWKTYWRRSMGCPESPASVALPQSRRQTTSETVTVCRNDLDTERRTLRILWKTAKQLDTWLMTARLYEMTSRGSRVVWSTVSQAVNISTSPGSGASKMSDVALTTAVWVKWWTQNADCSRSSVEVVKKSPRAT